MVNASMYGNSVGSRRAPHTRGTNEDDFAMAAENDTAAVPAENDLGLPGWLNDMLKPGVGAGVFMTLKLSLVGLVCTLAILLCYIQDEVCRAAIDAHMVASDELAPVRRRRACTSAFSSPCQLCCWCLSSGLLVSCGRLSKKRTMRTRRRNDAARMHGLDADVRVM